MLSTRYVLPKQPEQWDSLSKSVSRELLETTIQMMKSTGYDRQDFGFILRACFASRHMFSELMRMLQSEKKVTCVYFVAKSIFIYLNETPIRYAPEEHGSVLLKHAIQNTPFFDGVMSIPRWLRRMLLTRDPFKYVTFNVQLMSERDIDTICMLPYVNSVKVDYYNERTSNILLNHATVKCFDFGYVINQGRLPRLHEVNINNTVTDYTFKHRYDTGVVDPSEFLNKQRHKRIWENVQTARNLVINETLVAGARTSRLPFVNLAPYKVYVTSHFTEFRLNVTMKITTEHFNSTHNVVDYPKRLESEVKKLFRNAIVPRVKVNVRYEWMVKDAGYLTSASMHSYSTRLKRIGFKGITANEGSLWVFKQTLGANVECIVEFRLVNQHTLSKQRRRWSDYD